MTEQDERKEVKQVEQKPFYTAKEVAKVLGIKADSIRKLREREKLVGIQVDKRTFVYTREELQRAAQERDILLDFVETV